MKFLLTGAEGQLGKAWRRLAQAERLQLEAFSRQQLDITRPELVREIARRVRPEVIINAAAYTAVDKAEEEPDRAFAVNAEAVATLAGAANEVRALLVHVSSDYVFDGTSRKPYREEDPTNPLSVYGKSKLAGEEAAKAARDHLIIRTSWLFGSGWNFVEAIRKQLHAGADELRVVADQRGRPTYAEHLAWAMLKLVEKGARGVTHVANHGSATWADFAAEIVRLLGYQTPVVPITTAAVGRPAPRPTFSVLDTSRLEAIVGPLPPWQEALACYLGTEVPIATPL